MEQDIRTSLDAFSARLRAAIDGELDGLAKELSQAADDAISRVRNEAEVDAAAREAAARDEAEVRLSQRVDEARATALAEATATAAAEAEQTAARQIADAATARAAEREARLAAVERLLSSVRSIDASTSLRDTLEVLVQTASLETPRVAVLLIEGDSVRPFSHRGFDGIPASGPLAAGGVVEACVLHGQSAFTGDAAGLKAPGFAALADDRAGFAAPLRVGNRTVAVLYADDAAGEDHDAPAAWPEALELLARHASIHLENMTALRAASGSPPPFRENDASPVSTMGSGTAAGTDTAQDAEAARRYARILVSEIKLYNEPAVRLGREHKDLRTRLHDDIERARRTYLDRVPETVAARDEYFDRELLQTLAGGDSSIL
ncbi:MAG: GAF domain-containing protein [Vicinamibacterales bacterium]